jgi:hypothetical protein
LSRRCHAADKDPKDVFVRIVDQLPGLCAMRGTVGGCLVDQGNVSWIFLSPHGLQQLAQREGIPHNFVSGFAHELGHLVGCGAAENCARAAENLTRQQLGMPLRPFLLNSP